MDMAEIEAAAFDDKRRLTRFCRANLAALHPCGKRPIADFKFPFRKVWSRGKWLFGRVFRIKPVDIVDRWHSSYSVLDDHCGTQDQFIHRDDRAILGRRFDQRDLRNCIKPQGAGDHHTDIKNRDRG